MDNTSNGTFIDINGLKLYTERYRPYHDRPTLVFLHDSLGSVRLWRDFPRELADSARCNLFVYDRQGHGRSGPMPGHERPVNYMEPEAELLNDLLEQEGIRDAILFGHSDGGTIALWAASKYPRNIKAVIVEAAHIFVEELTLEGIHNTLHAYKTTDLPERLAKYHGEKTDALFKAWAETWTRSDYRDWNIEHVLPAITCPLLFLQGEADEYGSLAQVDKTIGQIHGRAEKLMLPGIGHAPHKEAREQVLQAARKFIESLNA